MGYEAAPILPTVNMETLSAQYDKGIQETVVAYSGINYFVSVCRDRLRCIWTMARPDLELA